MANDTIETCPAQKRYDGFHIIRPDGVQIQWYGLADTVVAVAGDVIIAAGAGGADLGADGTVTAANFLGIAAADAGVVTASANDDTKIPVYVPDHSTQFWAKVGTGTAAATDVGEIVDLEDEDAVDVSDQDPETPAAEEMLVGFKIMAVDDTNNYVKGVFVGF